MRWSLVSKVEALPIQRLPKIIARPEI